MSSSRPPSASKRARMLHALVGQVAPTLPGATPAIPRFVDCRGTTRRDRCRTALTGCRERLAEIRVEANATIAFVVLAPIHDDNGAWVLERTAQPGHPETIVRPPGRRATFRCARCGKATTVNLVELRTAARAQG